MKVAIDLDVDLDEKLEKIKLLLKNLNELQEVSKSICFLSVSEFAKVYGCTVVSAREVFNRKDFPCSRFSNEKKVEIHALINYFSVPR